MEQWISFCRQWPCGCSCWKDRFRLVCSACWRRLERRPFEFELLDIEHLLLPYYLNLLAKARILSRTHFRRWHLISYLEPRSVRGGG